LETVGADEVPCRLHIVFHSFPSLSFLPFIPSFVVCLESPSFLVVHFHSLSPSSILFVLFFSLHSDLYIEYLHNI
jgi:hypothetical protein